MNPKSAKTTNVGSSSGRFWRPIPLRNRKPENVAGWTAPFGIHIIKFISLKSRTFDTPYPKKPLFTFTTAWLMPRFMLAYWSPHLTGCNGSLRQSHIDTWKDGRSVTPSPPFRPVAERVSQLRMWISPLDAHSIARGTVWGMASEARSERNGI